MKRLMGWVVLVPGVAMVTLGETHSGGEGFLPWSNIIIGHGVFMMMLGLALVTTGSRARVGTVLDWQKRAIGAALAILFTLIWRVSMGAVHEAGSSPIAWIGYASATVTLMLPAVCCWVYVFTTFFHWLGPHPMPDEQPARARSTSSSAAA